jgi:hypothetical protein
LPRGLVFLLSKKITTIREKQNKAYINDQNINFEKNTNLGEFEKVGWPQKPLRNTEHDNRSNTNIIDCGELLDKRKDETK